LEVDEKYKLRGDTFAEAIRKDKEQGFIPFYVSPVYLIFLYRSNVHYFHSFISLKKHKIAERERERERENSVYYVNVIHELI